jgi:hypothetical protein
MAESAELKNDLSQINKGQDVLNTRRAPQKPLTPAEEMVKVILQADVATKNLINRALGNPTIRKKQSQGQDPNAEVREHVRSIGESTRVIDETTITFRNKLVTNEKEEGAFLNLQFEGFVPCPPEGVTEKGVEAIHIWVENWRQGNQISASSMDFDSELQDAEALARIAHM